MRMSTPAITGAGWATRSASTLQGGANVFSQVIDAAKVSQMVSMRVTSVDTNAMPGAVALVSVFDNA